MGLNIQPGFVGADQNGPVIRWEDNDRELEIAMLRWGFPKVSEKHKSYITNIRNLESSWWKNVNRRYVEDASYRCLVPFDRFSEWDASKRENAWFSVDAEQAYFAGIWRPWTGERLKDVGEKRRKRSEDQWELYAFLTTEPCSTVKAIHPKAMPVILTTKEECRDWMRGIPALELQRPLPDAMVNLIDK